MLLTTLGFTTSMDLDNEAPLTGHMGLDDLDAFLKSSIKDGYNYKDTEYCKPLFDKFSDILTIDDRAHIACINGYSAGSFCNIDNTNLFLEMSSRFVVCKCEAHKTDVTMTSCDWRNVTEVQQTAMLMMLPSKKFGDPHETDNHDDEHAEEGAGDDELYYRNRVHMRQDSDHVQAQPHEHAELYDVEDSECGAVQAPLNGYLHCESPNMCSLRCNAGYIPENVQPDGAGQTSLQICYAGTTEWTKAPFSRCTKFEDFCWPNMDDLHDDPLAIYKIDYSVPGEDHEHEGDVEAHHHHGGSSEAIGKITVDAKCKDLSDRFEKVGKGCVKEKCFCKRRRELYYCIKTRESLDFGLCSNVTQRINL